MTSPPDAPPPELSVVIAALDAATTLGAQLRALRDQRPAWPWEVLVCDNGSRDGTRELVLREVAGMPGLRLVDASERRGPAAARNVGVEHARAPRVAFCDADDVVAPGWVAAMREALGSADLVLGRLDHDTLASGARTSWTQQSDGPLVLDVVPGLACGGAGCMGVGREAFLAVGGFCPDLVCGEDVDLCWRLQLAGAVFREAPGAVVQVRHRDTLRGVFRQQRGWQRGDRRLRERYAVLRAAGLGDADRDGSARAAAPASADEEARGARPAPGGRGLRRVARLATRAGRADAAARLGQEAGRRSAGRGTVPVLTEQDVARWTTALRAAGGRGAPRRQSEASTA